MCQLVKIKNLKSNQVYLHFLLHLFTRKACIFKFDIVTETLCYPVIVYKNRHHSIKIFLISKANNLMQILNLTHELFTC